MTRLFSILIAIAIIIVSILALACSNAKAPEDVPEEVTTLTPADPPQIPDRGFFKGFASILPPDGQFDGPYQKASEHAEFVNIWVGAAGYGYWDLADYLAGWWGDQFVERLVRGNGMFPIINLSFIDKDLETGLLILKVPQGMEGATLSDSDFRNAYKQGALDAARASKPLYLSVGNEVNRWYEQYGAEAGDPNGFQHFVSLYEEIYDAVKELSPETNVFCIFSREIVDGLREADLSVVEMFDPEKLDILVFTSYPFAVQGINSPSDVPDDYYSRILDCIGVPDKPFAFTELAWSTLDPFGGEQAQAEFLTDAAGRLTAEQGMNLHLFGWWSLIDLDADPHNTGLIAQDGREKEAYRVWESM
ncbi:MAG TPA: hypothetical protein G4O13_07150 [Dehalococcoidia bacterium]|nr:hypothetical protein [Dehalococcoidia bacterium]